MGIPPNEIQNEQQQQPSKKEWKVHDNTHTLNMDDTKLSIEIKTEKKKKPSKAIHAIGDMPALT